MNDKNQTTPLMNQYQSIKDNYKDAVLFFRLGDFYEMFNDDALEVSRLLQLTLTHHNGNPMCGVPAHAAKIYIARLLKLGKKVAVCEQTSMPVSGKGLSERKVLEVITPGSTVEDDYLENGVHNYIAALCPCRKDFFSFSYLDISTTDFFCSSWEKRVVLEQASKEIARLMPKELLAAQSLEKESWFLRIKETYPAMIITVYPDWHFSQELSYKRLLQQFKTVNLRSFELTEHSHEIASAGFLLEYVSTNSGNELPHITGISRYVDSEYVILDESSRKNLEIISNLRDGTSQFTLLEVLAKTVTPMGHRLLRSWLSSALTNKTAIQNRQNHVGIFFNNRKLLEQVRTNLSGIYDIERLASRIAMERATARDLQSLRISLTAYLQVRNFFSQQIDFCNIDVTETGNIIALIEKAIQEEPSNVFNEGNLIKRGFSEYVDHLHEMQTNFSSILEQYLMEEKEKTGITNLKVRYNRIDGYYIEVTKGNLNSVPAHFIRRRSLVNAERFTTERLEKLEQELLSADEKIIEEERRLFLEIRQGLQKHIEYLFSVSQEIALLDLLTNLAFCAQKYRWVCPEIIDEQILDIKNGRHPVVEMHLPSGEFVPNDLLLDEKNFALITGPNMAGKSTYLRQNALIVLLAQIGSYVPAENARIGIVDRIFCRVGASDNLARGESTFLVEMTETAHIVRSATKKSLVIMDEVGRGTSTEDGLSIAWAVSEYILSTVAAKTLFATHYHELTRITHPKLQLLCLAVLEQDGRITFLKRIREGASENSYGIHVAKLAGIPQIIVERAQELLQIIQQKTPSTNLEIPFPSAKPQNSLFSEEDLVLSEILSLDLDSLTPLQALQRLTHWKKQLLAK